MYERSDFDFQNEYDFKRLGAACKSEMKHNYNFAVEKKNAFLKGRKYNKTSIGDLC